MSRRHLPVVLLAALILGPGALAQEGAGGDPWVGAEGEPPDPVDLPDEPEAGPDGQPALPTRLFRCRMDGLESARYSIAELKLQRGDVKAAIADLLGILETTKREELRDVTNLNLGELHGRWLRDHEAATRHYQAVSGILRHAAHRRLLALLARAGKADEAAKATDAQIAKANEKGEKLALLHRLALAFRRHNLPDRALAIYDRITKEFTPEDLRQMREAAEREVAAAIEKIRRLQAAEREEEVERVLDFLNNRRPQELRAAGRWDELAAFEKARDDGLARLEQQGEEPPEPPKKAEF